MTLRGTVEGADLEVLRDAATRHARALHGFRVYMDSPCLFVSLGDVNDVTPPGSDGPPTFRADYIARVAHDFPPERITDREVPCRRCGEA